MSLLALSPEEQAFLASPGHAYTTHPAPASGTDFAARLERRIVQTLHARLRVPLQLVPCERTAATVSRPHWQVGSALAGLWLSARLGGGAGTAGRQGESDYVPPALLRTLDAVLAECWLDAPAVLPAGLAWRFAASPLYPVLALDLPASTADMQHWARETIA